MLGQKRDGLITIRFRFVNTYTYFLKLSKKILIVDKIIFIFALTRSLLSFHEYNIAMENR